MSGTGGCGFCSEEVEARATDVVNPTAHDFSLELTRKDEQNEKKKQLSLSRVFLPGWIWTQVSMANLTISQSGGRSFAAMELYCACPEVHSNPSLFVNGWKVL